MARLKLRRDRTEFLVTALGITLGLSACAAPAPVLPPEHQTVNFRGTMLRGSVAAIRPFTPQTGQTGLSAGSRSILTALNVPLPGAPVTATEFVIQGDDGTIATVVLRSPPGTPGASLAAGGFSPGDHVELINGVQPELLHGN